MTDKQIMNKELINDQKNTIHRLEQECEELGGKLKYIRDENVHLKESATDEQMDFLALNNYIRTLEFQLDQLKAEVKSKKEYIQEQREIIDQYSKEIRMYKNVKVTGQARGRKNSNKPLPR